MKFINLFSSSQASTPPEAEVLLALRADIEATANHSIERENSLLRQQGIAQYSKEHSDYFYFVTRFTSQLAVTYGVYQIIKGNDTVWNNICNFFRGYATKKILQAAVTEAVGVGTQAAGVDAEGQAVAKGVTTTLVNTMFFFYTIHTQRKKEENIHIADSFLAFSSTPPDFESLARNTAVRLFMRLRLFIGRLKSPEGIDELIDFIISYLTEAMSKTNKTAISSKGENKSDFFLSLCIPPHHSSAYKRNLKAIPITAVTKEGEHHWTLLGGLCHAPIIVTHGNILYGYEEEIRGDAKYPPHFLSTQQEAAELGLRKISDFIWNGFEGKKLKAQFKVIENIVAYLIELIIQSNPNNGDAWLEEQLSKVADAYWSLFQPRTDREQRKDIFDHYLYLAEKLQSVAKGKFNVVKFNIYLTKILELLQDQSEIKSHPKWIGFHARIQVLIPQPSPPLMLTSPLSTQIAFSAPAAPAPLNQVVVYQGAQSLPQVPTLRRVRITHPALTKVEFPPPPITFATPESSEAAGAGAAAPRSPLNERENKTVTIKLWKNGSNCSHIAIITQGSGGFQVAFTVPITPEASPSSFVLESPIEGQPYNPVINGKIAETTYVFHQLNSVDINSAWQIWNSPARGDLQSAYLQLNRVLLAMRKNYPVHIKLVIFFLSRGGISQFFFLGAHLPQATLPNMITTLESGRGQSLEEFFRFLSWQISQAFTSNWDYACDFFKIAKLGEKRMLTAALPATNSFTSFGAP